MNALKLICLAVTLAVTCVLNSGCDRQRSALSPRSDRDIPAIVATNKEGISEIAKIHIRFLHSTEGAPSLANVVLSYDAAYFVNKHRKEIVDTFEVAEVLELQNVALALTRFSVGGTVYRKPLWFTKRDGRWLVSISQYASEYTIKDGFLRGEDLHSATNAVNMADTWTKQSADLWFWP